MNTFILVGIFRRRAVVAAVKGAGETTNAFDHEICVPTEHVELYQNR